MKIFFHYFLAFSNASSIVPTYINALSGNSSQSPFKIASKPEIESSKDTYFTGEPRKGKTEAFYYVSKISLGSNRFSVAVQTRDYDMKNLKIIPREPSNDIRVFDFESEEKF